MSTPKSPLGTLVSKIAAEKNRLFASSGEPGLSTIGAILIISAVASAGMYQRASEVFFAAAPANVAEAARAVDDTLSSYSEVNDAINAVLYRGLAKIASTDLSSLTPKEATATIRHMASETLADAPDFHDRDAINSDVLAAATPATLRELARSGQTTDAYDATLASIAESDGVSPDVLHELAASALKNAGDDVPALAYLDVLDAIEKGNNLKAIAFHEIQTDLRSLKEDKNPDLQQASQDLKNSALSGLHGDSAAGRIAVMALAKAEMAAGGSHGAEVTAAYNKTIALNNFFEEVIGKNVDFNINPATLAELIEKTQAQLSSFETAEVVTAHKM